ncbi:MAG TPA: hypothetical protein VK891_12715, partial [Euzebyales bacterium]|nr:hypothetical protein [Euzebyales bacterium]
MRTEDDRLIVEAATAAEALDVVAQQLGTRARIAGVERVRRGGVGGFFARELVQVTATGEDVKVQPEQPATNASATENTVDALLRTISERDDPFAAALQRQIAPPANGNGHAAVDGEPAAERAAVAGAAVDAAQGDAAGPRAGRAPTGPGPAERWAAALASAAPDA